MKHFTNIFPHVLFAALFASIPTQTHAQVTEEWVQTYSGANSRAMELDNAGNIYATGTHYDGTIRRAIVFKYDASGALLWSQTFLPGSSDTHGYVLAIDGNGDVIIAGRTNSSQGFTAKYTASGTLLWSQTTSIQSRDIAVDASNNVYVLSSEEGNWTGEIVKYSASGVQQWVVSAPYAENIVVNEANIYITGHAFINLGRKSSWLTRVASTVKYNATNGAQVWVANYPDPDGSYGVDLAVDGTGNVFTTALVWTKAGKQGKTQLLNPNWVTLKYNASGVQQWARIYDGNATETVCSDVLSCNGTTYDIPHAIALDNNGNIIVTGVSYTTSSVGSQQYTSDDMTVVKYSASGVQQWVRTYDGPQHGRDLVNSIVTTASGSIYITGTVNSLSGPDRIATTIKYNAPGSQQWVATYSFPWPGFGTTANTVRLDNTGNVYVAGAISGTGSGWALLVKYSQTGIPKEEGQGTVPETVSLDQNYPNPFNPSTMITYSLAEESKVMLKVFNVLGMEVATLVNETKSSGTHSVTFDARALPSGVYTYSLSISGQTLSKRMMLLK